MEFKLSQNAENILKNSYGEAVRLNSDRIETEHILLSILRTKQSKACIYLNQVCDCEQLKFIIEQELKETESDFGTIVDKNDMTLGEGAEKVIKISNLESLKFHKKEVGSEDLLSAILHYKDSNTATTLRGYGISYESFERYRRENSSQSQIVPKEDNKDRDLLIAFEKHNSESSNIGSPVLNSRSDYSNPTPATPMLDSFGKNLSKLAENGDLDPVIGRENEIEHICRILSRRKKNNPILIGEPGVGKSSIAEGLAIRIAEKNIPFSLLNKKIYTLDLALVVAGTKYRGQFEERIKNLIAELEKNKDIIVFIDEIHTIAGAGNSEGGLDASNIFKPALARGEIQCIGATTIEEYRKYIEADGALERRFQKILIEPTDIVETITILENIKGKYESFHNVIYSDEAIKACVTLTDRYITDRNLPDKAIDIMDEVGANKHIHRCNIPEEIKTIHKSLIEAKREKHKCAINQEFEKALAIKNKIDALQIKLKEEEDRLKLSISDNPQEVNEQDVAIVISQSTGISIEKLEQNEKQKLLNMQDVLSKQVIGQKLAVEKVCQAIKRARTGLKDPNRPSGSFIFIGSTGVGKTLLAKKLAQYLFGSQDNLIRIDMSEYMEKFSVSKLIGAPPGYVGYEQAGQLTEKVRTHPYSIILFDEIEKAHPDVFNLLLQILDEGHLTDASGRKTDFKNTIIIMTSNVGSRKLKDFGVGVGFSTTTIQKNIASLEQGVIEKDLKKTFSPEFLNRIDEIVFFNSLDSEDMIKIVDLELSELKKRLSELKYELNVSKEAKELIITQTEDSQYGARPIKRGIQSMIETPLSDLLLEQSTENGGEIYIDSDKENNQLTFKIKNKDSEI